MYLWYFRYCGYKPIMQEFIDIQTMNDGNVKVSDFNLKKNKYKYCQKRSTYR